ncbi:Na(+)/H(+) antiporter subunit D [Sedimentitalea sp. XS_ASV28]|uniref:Na(+)/H(+) antiporter subunit D n=1 Tax=Sedimentitalea sp. XS_ASV28 TaxID=3241296 RepID=UPI003511C113
MLDALPTAFLFFLAALILPILPRGPLRSLLVLIVSVVAGLAVYAMPMGNLVQTELFGFTLDLMRVDPLSRVFALLFCIAAFLGGLFAWHLRDTVQQVAMLLYVGAAIGAVFAGDLVTLFFYWEGTAISSVFLIWARRSEGSYFSGMRYLTIQIGSGVMLLAGIILHYSATGSIAFDAMTLDSPASWLIFIAFGVKAAFILLNNWMIDAYPSATVTGTVILSAFTTKLAIYALARGFAGTELLIYIGAATAVYPLIWAQLENDLRRVVAYALNLQQGFMFVGIGIGTELALNGAIAHAFVGVLYGMLLFMTLGAVMYRTGTSRATDLGGIYKTMPLTALFCLVGAASISAFPLFAGFVSKSLIISATAKGSYYVVWGCLLLASAGGFLVCGLKVPFFAFFSKDSGLRPREAPGHMLLVMGLTAVLCVHAGTNPTALYSLLPYDVSYQPYSTGHIITQLQLLLFSALAFALLLPTRLYPRPNPTVNLDFDWVYRRLLLGAIGLLAIPVRGFFRALDRFKAGPLKALIRTLYNTYGPMARTSQFWPTGAMVLWIAILLGVTLLVSYAS